jgi:alcohol sulfotransferase
VRALLSHGYHQAFGTPSDKLVDADVLHAIDPRIPIFFFTHISNESDGLRRQLVPGRLAEKTVIGLVRDPRDAAVSRYYHERHRFQSRQGRPLTPADDRPLVDFLRDGAHGVKFYVDSINRLKPFADGHRDFHLFTYESFKRDPAGELARLLAAAGTPLPAAAITAAVDFAAFDKMQKREADGFYQTKKLRPGDPAEPNSFKVRRGKVGGYKDELAADDAAMLDRLVDEQLVQGFGYRSDEKGVALGDGALVGAG